MQKFELVLKNEKVKQYNLLALLIIFSNIIFFVTLLVTANDIKLKTRAAFAIIIIGAAFITAWLAKKKNKKFKPEGTAIFIIIVAYLLLQYWWPAIITALLGFLYIISQRRLIVRVSAAIIIYPSFPRRTIEWNELNNIILKDDLLTIDFKNNKLAQVLVINGENDNGVNEKEFNDFCGEQLKKNKSSGGDDSPYDGFTEMLNVIQ